MSTFRSIHELVFYLFIALSVERGDTRTGVLSGKIRGSHVDFIFAVQLGGTRNIRVNRERIKRDTVYTQISAIEIDIIQDIR